MRCHSLRQKRAETGNRALECGLGQECEGRGFSGVLYFGISVVWEMMSARKLLSSRKHFEAHLRRLFLLCFQSECEMLSHQVPLSSRKRFEVLSPHARHGGGPRRRRTPSPPSPLRRAARVVPSARASWRGERRRSIGASGVASSLPPRRPWAAASCRWRGRPREFVATL